MTGVTDILLGTNCSLCVHILQTKKADPRIKTEEKAKVVAVV